MFFYLLSKSFFKFSLFFVTQDFCAHVRLCHDQSQTLSAGGAASSKNSFALAQSCWTRRSIAFRKIPTGKFQRNPNAQKRVRFRKRVRVRGETEPTFSIPSMSGWHRNKVDIYIYIYRERERDDERFAAVRRAREIISLSRVCQKNRVRRRIGPFAHATLLERRWKSWKIEDQI